MDFCVGSKKLPPPSLSLPTLLVPGACVKLFWAPSGKRCLHMSSTCIVDLDFEPHDESFRAIPESAQ